MTQLWHFVATVVGVSLNYVSNEPWESEAVTRGASSREFIFFIHLNFVHLEKRLESRQSCD